MGNICRSPMAEGLFRNLLAEAGLEGRVGVDSAGTHADARDRPPDQRAQKLLAERGIDISGQRSRPIAQADFERFDLIVVMDGHNLDMLRFVCPRRQAGKLSLLLDYAPKIKARDVPDPYQREDADFLKALDLLDAGTRGLLEHLRERFNSD
jgi:protein-tyrosine phosphatase